MRSRETRSNLSPDIQLESRDREENIGKSIQIVVDKIARCREERNYMPCTADDGIQRRPISGCPCRRHAHQRRACLATVRPINASIVDIDILEAIQICHRQITSLRSKRDKLSRVPEARMLAQCIGRCHIISRQRDDHGFR